MTKTIKAEYLPGGAKRQELLDQVLGFPQGKIEENETLRACAARQAYEEIGFDVKTILDPRTWFEKVEIILFQI